MPNNFGDVFVQSYRHGTKLAQDEAQHAQAVALEEQKLAATQAMEAAKLEALNKQIVIAENERQDRANYQHDSTLNQRSTTFNSSYVPMGENKYTEALNIKPLTKEQLKRSFPGVEIPEGTYVDSQSGQAIAGLIAYDRQLAAQQTAIDKANAPIKLANELNNELDKFSLPQNIVKSTTTPNSMISRLWDIVNGPIFDAKNIYMPMGVGPALNAARTWATNENTTEVTSTPDLPAIKKYLEDTAPTMSKIFNRGMEDVGKFHSEAVTNYADYAQEFLVRDKAGNIDLKIPNASSTTERLAKKALTAVHTMRYNYVIGQAMSNLKEAQMSRDKDAIAEANTKYQSILLEAEQNYPLHGLQLGQIIGQRYVK